MISLNTEVCYTLNFQLWSERNDPGGMLAWLHTTLLDIEANNEVAIIFGHVPPSDLSCHYDWAVRFKALTDRFQHIIRFSLWGHVHMEMHHLARAVVSDKAVGVSFWAGSVTPFVVTNPSFRVIEVD